MNRILRRFILTLTFISILSIGYAAAEPEARETAKKLSLVSSAFSKINDFKADYMSLTFHEGMTEVNGKLVGSYTEYLGHLKFKKPSGIRADFAQTHYPAKKTIKQFFISDGKTNWSYHPEPKLEKEAGGIKYVSKTTLDLFSMMSPELPAITPLRMALSAGISDLQLDPFKEIAKERISFQGTEKLRGSNVLKFVARAAPGHSNTVHHDKILFWIGLSDGIPRKVEVYSSFNGKLNTKCEFINIEINTNIPDSVFTFKESEQYRVLDTAGMMKKELERASDKRVIYESIFKTPISKIKNLKGGGRAHILETDQFIRFESDEKVELKNPDHFRKGENIDEAIAWFKEKIPSDADKLKTRAELEFQSVGDLYWYLSNKKAGVYFLRMQSSFGPG